MIGLRIMATAPLARASASKSGLERLPRRPRHRSPRRRLPRRAADNRVRDADREEVRSPVAGRVGGELQIPTLVRHAGDDEAEPDHVVEPPVDEVQFTRTVAHEHGRERSTGAAAAGVEFLWSGHSMTWSARASSDGGILRPRAFAVLRLTTRSNFVGRSTGRSPAFVPLRILST